MSPNENKGFGYGKMFKDAEGFWHKDEDLIALGEAMTDKNNLLKDSKLPAGYTYLGQFIDHGLAFDSQARTFPSGKIEPKSLINERSPFIDLDCLYGNGPVDSEELYQSNTLLKLGYTHGGQVANRRSFPNDLPRINGSLKARIGDPRNDENLIVAQTHVAFIKFHNAVVKALGDTNSPATFKEAKQIVIKYYQWIILTDFLPKIIKVSVLEDVIKNGNKFYKPNLDNPYMPLEFSVAAYRMGHSMIRSSYTWNKHFLEDRADLLEISKFTERGGMLGLFNNLPTDWLIDWTRFYDFSKVKGVKNNEKRNFALQIAPYLNPILKLIIKSPPDNPIGQASRSLAVWDLFRCRALGLPTGQSVAKKVNPKLILKPADIAKKFPNTFSDELKETFALNTPLWYYILAEAEIQKDCKGERLGEVGSRIVAETFVALIKASSVSVLKDSSETSLNLSGNTKNFSMPELLKFVSDQNRMQDYDELHPLKYF